MENNKDQSGAAVRDEAVAEVGCETDEGLLNIHPESETCEVCAAPASPRAADAPSEPSKAKTYEDGRIDGERLGRAAIDIHNNQMAMNCHYRERVFNEIIALDSTEGLSRFARVKSRAADASFEPSDKSAFESGRRVGLMLAANMARQLYSQHVHHHGVNGLLKRCGEMEDKLVTAADALDSQPTDDARALGAGRNLMDYAKRAGWPDDGEGAFEFLQRTFYEAGRASAARAASADAVRRYNWIRIPANHFRLLGQARWNTPEQMDLSIDILSQQDGSEVGK